MQMMQREWGTGEVRYAEVADIHAKKGKKKKKKKKKRTTHHAGLQHKQKKKSKLLFTLPHLGYAELFSDMHLLL
ncbi:hypothetical protein POVWA1_060010 [Plasmodium ovale wallikeri]|uniref:Uncharacterized protein n=1 Tax=Plasmodium ovale wallikeri TaxID=864142 RepID=A0A1A8ZZT9_PLAOA|nr:hypothetical protein POVWA1_060010 [Plasmodium ovale wallikeri]